MRRYDDEVVRRKMLGYRRGGVCQVAAGGWHLRGSHPDAGDSAARRGMSAGGLVVRWFGVHRSCELTITESSGGCAQPFPSGLESGVRLGLFRDFQLCPRGLGRDFEPYEAATL